MPIETVNQGLDRRFVDVADVGRSLARFVSHDNTMRID